MDNKTCTVCNIEKHIKNFHNKYSECKGCNIKRVVKHYYENKNKITNQQKIYYEKNRDKLLQKQNDYRNKSNAKYKELHRSYVEIQNKLKALVENLKIIDSEKHLKIYKRNVTQTTEKELC